MSLNRLLLVDDEPAVLSLVKKMLERAKYVVTTCGSGAEALKLLEKGEFDCMVTDAIMPVMTGYDLVRAVRKHPSLAELPVLMLTRKRHRQDVKKAVEVGVTDYVLKPIDEHLLLEKVELCLRKGEGKRHVFALNLSGDHARASLALPCEISALSESDVTLRVPLGLLPEHGTELDLPVFQEIGIETPTLKFVRCDAVSDQFEAKFAFVGVPESDLRKIRTWLQKQEIRRRK